MTLGQSLFWKEQKLKTLKTLFSEICSMNYKDRTKAAKNPSTKYIFHYSQYLLSLWDILTASFGQRGPVFNSLTAFNVECTVYKL